MFVDYLCMSDGVLDFKDVVVFIVVYVFEWCVECFLSDGRRVFVRVVKRFEIVVCACVVGDDVVFFIVVVLLLCEI